jgi:primosomal protein N' (replication factor Y)
LEKAKKALAENKKIILYINRRWEFSSLICTDCSNLFKCKNCDVSLTVHNNNTLVCHYCWYSENMPMNCSECHSANLKKVWVWTQQIEWEIKKYFPDKKAFRFDTDSIKKVSDKKTALESLNNADIIIWTKMITTWFDFENVGVIWVILLEGELWIPEYNTEEKVYSNIKQVIGRWWRKWEETDIIIQTFIPDNNVVKLITEWNYKWFLSETLGERKLFWYPPYQEYAEVVYRHKDKEKAKDFAIKINNKLEWFNKENKWNINLLNIPERKNNSYHYKVIIRGKNTRELIDNIKGEIYRNSTLIVNFK